MLHKVFRRLFADTVEGSLRLTTLAVSLRVGHLGWACRCRCLWHGLTIYRDFPTVKLWWFRLSIIRIPPSMRGRPRNFFWLIVESSGCQMTADGA